MTKKKQSITIITIMIIILLLAISTFIIYYEKQTQKKALKQVEEEVLSYLNEKYDDDFKIETIDKKGVGYTLKNCTDNCEASIPSSVIYEMKINGSIPFTAFYVKYETEESYEKYIDYDIPQSGIYEDYLYQLKTEELKNRLKKTLDEVFQYGEVELSFTTLTEESVPILYSTTTEESIASFKHFKALKQDISILEYYEEFEKVNPGTSVELNFKIYEDITKDNLEEFKEKIKTVVNALKENGFTDFYINITGFNYITCQVSLTQENEEEMIYLLFDYALYSNIDPTDKLTMYTYK